MAGVEPWCLVSSKPGSRGFWGVQESGILLCSTSNTFYCYCLCKPVGKVLMLPVYLEPCNVLAEPRRSTRKVNVGEREASELGILWAGNGAKVTNESQSPLCLFRKDLQTGKQKCSIKQDSSSSTMNRCSGGNFALFGA